MTIRGMLERAKDAGWLKREFWQMFRYGIIGGVSTLIFLGSYAVFSRVIWPGGQKTLLDAFALAVSSTFNFTFHRAWTFKARGFSSAMIARYLAVISSSSLIQVGLFHLGVSAFRLNDFFVQIALVPIIAALQYVEHRMFTFHPRFDRKAAPAPMDPVLLEVREAEAGVLLDAEASPASDDQAGSA